MPISTRREFLKNASLGIAQAIVVDSFPTLIASTVNESPKRGKIIVMSDAHLGVEESLLNTFSHEKHAGTRNMDRLKSKIEEQGQIDEIVLLGDVIDFTFSCLYDSYGNAKEFFSAVGGLGIPITYIPGNHDHHLWVQLVENDEIVERVTQNKLPLASSEYIGKFVDRVFYGGFATCLFPKEVKEKVNITYPHILRECGGQRYYFSHGHYLDAFLRFGNYVVEPKTLAELEAFNSWWLEGIWFYAGRGERFRKELKEKYKSGLGLTNIIKPWLFWQFGLSPPPVKFEDGPPPQTTEYEVKVSPVERAFAVLPWDDKKKTLIEYLEKYLRSVDPPFTFVYGHTHEKVKEGERSVRFKGKDCPVLNTGCWLKDDGRENVGFFVIDGDGPRWVPFFDEKHR